MKSNTISCKKLATIVSGQKYVARPFFRQKQVSTSAEMYSNSVFAWRRVVLHIFDLKQLLRVSCFLCCYYPKCYSTNLGNCMLNEEYRKSNIITYFFFGNYKNKQDYSHMKKACLKQLKRILYIEMNIFKPENILFRRSHWQ